MARNKIYASETYSCVADESCRLVMERLVYHMKDQGISYRSLGEAVGVSHPTVRRWLSVPGAMDLAQFFLVCQALALHDDEIKSLFTKTSNW